jgi:hypothetical protein
VLQPSRLFRAEAVDDTADDLLRVASSVRGRARKDIHYSFLQKESTLERYRILGKRPPLMHLLGEKEHNKHDDRQRTR